MRRKTKYNPLKFYFFLLSGLFMLLLGSTDNFSLLSLSQNNTSSFTYVHLSHPALIEPESVFSSDQPYHPSSSSVGLGHQNIYASYIPFPDSYRERLKVLELSFLKIKPLLLERFIKALNKIPKEIVPQFSSLK